MENKKSNLLLNNVYVFNIFKESKDSDHIATMLPWFPIKNSRIKS